jgi:hypothetical protein
VTTTPQPNPLAIALDVNQTEQAMNNLRAVNTQFFADATALLADYKAGLITISALNAEVAALEAQLAGSAQAAPVFTSDSPPAATQGASYSYTFVASGTPAPVLTESSVLAPGLSFSNGVLSGVPTSAGTFSFSVTATNAAGSVTAQASLVVNAVVVPPPTPPPTPPPPTSGPPVFPPAPTPMTIPSGLGHANNTSFEVSGYDTVTAVNYAQFMNIFPVGSPIVLAVNGQPQNPFDGTHATNSTAWKCEDLFNNVSAGPVTAGETTFNPTPPAGGNVFPCGWYNVKLYDGGQQISDGQVLVWNDNVPFLPTLSSLPNGAPAYLGGTSTSASITSPYDMPHWALGASCNLIPARMDVNDVTNPETGFASADWAQTQVGDESYLGYDVNWFSKYQTPQRPHQNICEFPNGTAYTIDCPGQKPAGETGTSNTGLGVMVQQAQACAIVSNAPGTVTVTSGSTTETWSGPTWGQLSNAINAGSKLIYSWTDSPQANATMFASIGVPSNYFEGVVGIVQALAALPNAPIFEGPYNEPLNTAASTVAQTVCFIKAVHQGGGKAMGPMPVTFNGSLLPWLQQVLQGLQNAGVLPDAISVHGYNTVNGDVILGDHCLGGLTSMIAGLDLSHIPVWMTETGEFVDNYGSLNWRSSTHWTALRTLLYEVYGIPCERQAYYYMTSHGFDDFPSYLIGAENRPAPQFAMFRGLAERTMNASRPARLTMPGPAERMVFGSVYNSATATTVMLLNTGPASTTVTLAGAGTATVMVYDWAGNSKTVSPNAAGQVTVTSTDLPTYVVLPAGSSVSVVDVDGGLAECTTDLALTAAAHSSSTSAEYGSPAQFNNGVFEDGAYYGDGSPIGSDPLRPFRDAVAPPAWAGLSWASPQTVSRVIITCPVPWQTQDAFLAFTVSTWNGSAWVQQYSYTNTTTASSLFPSGNADWKATSENYWDSTSTWDVVLPSPVSTEAVLVQVSACSWGDAPDQGAATASYNYQWPPALCLREIEVY